MKVTVPAIPPDIKLDLAFIALVEGPINRTWNYIESDAHQLGRVTNAGAMELCLDAGRMSMIDKVKGKAADELISAACKQHSYTNVDRFLRKHITLV